MTTSAFSFSHHRFVRLSRLMTWLTTLGIVVMWVAVLGIVLFVGLIVLEAYLPDWMRAQIRTQLQEASAGVPTTPHGLVLASLLLAIPISVILYGLIAVRRMFAAFARGAGLHRAGRAPLAGFRRHGARAGPASPADRRRSLGGHLGRQSARGARQPDRVLAPRFSRSTTISR